MNRAHTSGISYSNSNYYVLGSIIESVSGSTYPDYLTANVLRPAQLNNTTYIQPLSSASPYTPAWTDGALWDPSFTFAAGALWSNVLDLAIWNGALMTNTVLPEPLFTLTVTPPDVPVSGQSQASQYGMGWLRTTQRLLFGARTSWNLPVALADGGSRDALHLQ